MNTCPMKRTKFEARDGFRNQEAWEIGARRRKFAEAKQVSENGRVHVFKKRGVFGRIHDNLNFRKLLA